jgi:acetylglutamate/LysW-gamma-L-alpha-aminoadipate kinase
MSLSTVIKLGGRVARQPFLSKVAMDVTSLRSRIKFVVVHGGGDLVTAYAQKLNVPQRFVVSPSGIRSRLTDDETLNLCIMVMGGLVNTAVVQALEAEKVQAVGLTGADCSLIKAIRKERIVVINEGRKMVTDGRRSGKPLTINVSFLRGLLDMGITPVIAPLGSDQDGQMVNMDGDSVAAAIASALKADTLLFLSDVDGVIDGGRVLNRCALPEVEALARTAGYGMNRKLLAAVAALKGGVGRVIISNGKAEKPVSTALFEGRGTVISDV